VRSSPGDGITNELSRPAKAVAFDHSEIVSDERLLYLVATTMQYHMHAGFGTAVGRVRATRLDANSDGMLASMMMKMCCTCRHDDCWAAGETLV
jgi:hypothetical protein